MVRYQTFQLSRMPMDVDVPEQVEGHGVLARLGLDRPGEQRCAERDAARRLAHKRTVLNSEPVHVQRHGGQPMFVLFFKLTFGKLVREACSRLY